MPLEEGHWLPKNHLEVLDGHPERGKTSLIRRYYYPAIWGGCLALGFITTQMAMRKPFMSGVQFQIGGVAAAIAGGELYGRLKEKYYQEDEARLKYYVQTHREQFPDYKFVKIGDILEPWIPVR